jgi:hypothetical protein
MPAERCILLHLARTQDPVFTYYIRNHINALPLLEFCSRHATTVRITYTYGGGNRELVVSSSYLPYDSEEPLPSKEVKNVIDYCYRRKKQLTIGCDANAHHTLWGSTGVNPRGESLMEYLVSSNLNIPNHGNEPNFVVSNRNEVTDLTLGTKEIANLISNWHVSDETSLSDNRHLCFQIRNILINQVTYRNPRRINWGHIKKKSGNLTAKYAHGKGYRWVR